MKIWIIIFISFFITIKAQINIEYLDDVPAKFKKEYFSKQRVYNPLQVGNVWQYYYEDNKAYWTTKVVKDSLINGKEYFKKVNYETDPPSGNFISWERNDTISGVTFMLDYQDINNNGDSLEELPIDSLENPFGSRYKSYKYSFGDPFMWSGEKTILVGDTSWAIIEGDTVITRNFEITELFWGEQIADKFGIIFNYSESPVRYLTGAIINGKNYGIIVGVKNYKSSLPNKVSLSNNFPNPFNPTTQINYTIPSNEKVTLKIYDGLGREIRTLVNEIKRKGSYRVIFNAKGLSSGIYYYRLETRTQNITKTMILLK